MTASQDAPTRIYIIVARNIDIPAANWRGSISICENEPPHARKEIQKLCMTTGRIAAHIAHASMKMAEIYDGPAEAHNCEIYVLQISNSSEFTEVCDRMYKAGVAFVRYHDTDRLWDGEQLTALCTFPLAESHVGVFAGMKSYRCACNDVREHYKPIGDIAAEIWTRMRSGIIADFDNAVEVLREVNPDLCLYKVDGQFVFPVYAKSGGLSHKEVVYIVRPSYYNQNTDQFVMPCLAVEYDKNAATLVNAAILFDELASLVNPDGGDMGYPIKVPVAVRA